MKAGEPIRDGVTSVEEYAIEIKQRGEWKRALAGYNALGPFGPW
jgi:hypothetical protein